MTRLRETLAKAEDMAKGRDVAADDLALSAFGEVDPVNWSYEAVEALKRERS